MKKIFVIGLALLLILTGVSFAKQNKTGTQKIVIRYPNTQWYDAVYIAEAKGFFKEQGIEIQYVGQLPASQIVTAVASKSIDFGLRHTPLVAVAVAQGVPLKIVAGGTETIQEYPHMRYIIRKDSAIKEITDIAGKKVAINSFGACSEYVSREFLKRANLKDDINFTVLPDAQQEQSLEQGLIDVAIVHAPFSKKAVRNPALKELANDYAMDKGMSGMCPYFTHGDFIKKNPKAVKGFVTAVAKASDWAKTHVAEAEQIIAGRLDIKVADVEAWNYYEHQLVQPEAVKWWIDYLEKADIIKKGRVKVEALYTNEFNIYAPKKTK